MAHLILHDKPIATITKDIPFTFDDLYKLIDCSTIQLIDLDDGRIMACDEESKLRSDWESRINVYATQLYKKGRMSRKDFLEQKKDEGWDVIDEGEDDNDSISGNVVVLNREELN